MLPRALQHIPHPSVNPTQRFAATTSLGVEDNISAINSRLAATANKDDIASIHASIKYLQADCDKGAEAFRVLEARARLKYLARMQELLDLCDSRLTITSEDIPSDKKHVDHWLSNVLHGVDDLLSDAAKRLDDIGARGSETMTKHKGQSEDLTSERPQFSIDPEYLDIDVAKKKTLSYYEVANRHVSRI